MDNTDMHKHGTDRLFTTVKISKRLAKALKTLAMEDGRKLYALLDEAVETYLEKRTLPGGRAWDSLKSAKS